MFRCLCLGAEDFLWRRTSPPGFPQLKQTVLLTSLGQAADVHTLSVLAKRAKLPVQYKTLATADDVAGAASVILNVGVSLKGFGSAGVNLDTETARAKALFKAAKEKGIPVILTHIGGEERRDDMSNILLDVAMPQADAYIVYEKGNKDSYFDKNSAGKPIISVSKVMQIVSVLGALGSGK